VRRSADEIDTIAVGLVDRVTRRMRAAHRIGRTVVVRFRFDDYTRATRSRTLTEATAQTGDVLTAVRLLLAAAMPMIRERGLTLLGLSVGNLDGDSATQLELPFDGQPGLGLDLALDDVRTKFGTAAVTRAVLLHRDEGMSVPMLPD